MSDDWLPRSARERDNEGSGGRSVIIPLAVGIGLLVLVAVGFALVQSRRDAEHRAAEARMQAEMMRAEAEVREFEAGRVRADRRVAPTDPEFQVAPTADSWNERGQKLLNELDLDGAVEAFREAAMLDPKYEANLRAARERQAEQNGAAGSVEIAPPPRPAKRP